MSLNRIFPEISRAFALFDEPFFNIARQRFPASLSSNFSFPTLTDRNYFQPNVDVSETDKNYVIEAEVPGMKKEDLSVEFLNDGTLIMKGNIEQASEQAPTEELRSVDASGDSGDTVATTDTVSKPTYWTSERMRGHFHRSFKFPGKVDSENVKASYKDGLLSIFVPKIAPQGKQITIE